MTATDLIRSIRLMGDGPHPEIFFLYIGAHANEAVMGNGKPLRNITDFQAFLGELYDALDSRPKLDERDEVFINGKPTGFRARFIGPCHTCGHPHQSGEECSMLMGGAGPCGCRVGVTA